jgi:hypothetical protein
MEKQSTVWYERLIETAKKIIQKGEPLQPILFLRKGGKLGIVPLGPLADDKSALSFMLHVIVQWGDPDEYLFVTEGYLKMVDPKDEADTALGKLLVNGTLQVGQLASSEEGIVLLVGNREQEKLGTIVYRKRGKTVEFKRTEWIANGLLKGRFTGLRDRGFFFDQESDKSV